MHEKHRNYILLEKYALPTSIDNLFFLFRSPIRMSQNAEQEDITEIEEKEAKYCLHRMSPNGLCIE